LLLAVAVVAVVVILVATIIMSIISAVTTLVVTAITLAVITPVVTSIVTIVVTPVIVAIITSIHVVATIGPTVTVIVSIRSTITVVEALVITMVIVVAALGLLGVRGYSKGTLQLLTLLDGMFGVTVELALVVHDHVEVTFEEGGRSWWICNVSFTRSLSRPVSSIVVIFSIEVVHHRVLSVNYLVDIGHEVGNGMRVSFVDFLEELDVGDPLLVVGDEILVFDTHESDAVLEVAVVYSRRVSSHLILTLARW
jgi:hypothetical protein